MATITGTYIVERVRTILQDNNPAGGGIRWKDSELLQWINDAQREITVAKPSANAVTEAIPLVAGTLQTIPDNGVSLIKVTRNMGATGTTPGRALYVSDMEAMINENPNWHDPSDPIYSAANLAEQSLYFYDDNDPRRFYVFPPSDGTNQLEITYSAAPADLSVLTGTINIPDIYANQIIDYVLFRCYMKDARNDSTGNKANNHYQLFRESLGLRAQAQLSTSPNMKLEQSRAMQPQYPAQS